MSKTTMSFAASISYKPAHPERTAKRPFGEFDVMFQEWPNRESMARSIRMQECGTHKQTHWKPVQSLTPGEGY